MKENTNIKEDIIIMDGNIDLMMKSLDEKKVVLAAIELGEQAQQSVDSGFSEHFQAHVKLKEATDSGVCFCQKPATHLVYIWRD